MEQLKFKTNINCSACIARVGPVLDAATDIEGWEVDLNDDHRILTIKTKSLTAAEVSDTVKKAGFNAEAIV